MPRNRRARRALTLALTLTLAPTFARAQRSVTAADVASEAARTSADVRARDRDLSAAAAGVDQALAAYFPRLTVGASYNRLSDLGPFVLGSIVVAPGQPVGPVSRDATFVNVPLTIPALSNSTQLSATLAVPLSDYLLRLPQQHRAAERTRDAAAETIESARRRAALDGTLAYYQWVRAIRQHDIATRTLTQAQEHLADAQHMMEAGALARVDVLRAETAVANAELLVTRAASMRDASLERVRAVMHLDESAALTPGGDVEGDVGDPALPPTVTAMVDEAMASRPELRALRAQRGALDAQASAARAAWLPTVTAVGQILSANPNPRVFPAHDQFDTTWSVGASLTWSPNDLALGGASSRGLSARAESVEAQVGALRDALRGDLAAASTQLRETTAALRSTGRAVESAEEGWRVRNALFRSGRATTAELTDAEAELLRARLEHENVKVDRRVAVARVLWLLGRAR